MRIALGIEYDGRPFYGWQRQRQSPTVQELVEQAAARVADHDCAVHAAGRTDTGVHARCQIAHIDSSARRSSRQWVLGLNSHLPESIAVLWSVPVEADFHARFSAVERSYEYLICNRPVRPALQHGLVAWERRLLDHRGMHAAAQALLGRHDFSCFRARGCQAKSPVREITAISVDRAGDLVRLRVAANAFLYHMVRNIAGSLVLIGRGEQPPEWLPELLAGGDRTRAGVTAPACGLYFLGAGYPGRFGIPASFDSGS